MITVGSDGKTRTLRGDGGASNTDPYSMKEEPGNSWIKTGLHVMIVGSGAKTLDGYPREAKADPTKVIQRQPSG